MAEAKLASNTIRGSKSSAFDFTGSEGLFDKISTLFFDLDNTLIPTRQGDTKACRKLTEVLENQFGFTKEESVTATSKFLKSFRRYPDNSQTSLDSWRTYLWREALSKRYKHLAEEIYPKWLQLRFRYLALPAEFVQMLGRLREAGYLLALITNGPSNAQCEKIKKLHIRQYFDCVLVSSDMPWEKPNPNIFYAACNFLNVKPAECAMIGDKLETDIKGGRLANLGATLWLPLNQNETDLLSGIEYTPHIILRDLLDMLKLLPVLNVNPPSNRNVNVLSPIGKNETVQDLKNARRCSQISYSSGRTISTCNNDCHANEKWHFNHRNRRGASLPDIEYMNSELENSSDSICS